MTSLPVSKNPSPRDAAKKATYITTIKATWGADVFTAGKIVPERNLPRNKAQRLGNYRKPVTAAEQWSTPILQALAELAGLEGDVDVVRDMLVKTIEWRYRVTGSGEARLSTRDVGIVARVLREGMELEVCLRGEWIGKGRKGRGGMKGGGSAKGGEVGMVEEGGEGTNDDDDGEGHPEWSLGHPGAMDSPGAVPSGLGGSILLPSAGKYAAFGASPLPAIHGDDVTVSAEGHAFIDRDFYNHRNDSALATAQLMNPNPPSDSASAVLHPQGRFATPSNIISRYANGIPSHHHRMFPIPRAPITDYSTDTWYKPMYISENGEFVHAVSPQDFRTPDALTHEDWSLENQLRVADIQAGRAMIEADWWKARAAEIRTQLGRL